VDLADRVPVVTLDDFCARSSIARIDVIKMDIEGAELLALRVATAVLQSASADDPSSRQASTRARSITNRPRCGPCSAAMAMTCFS
jgi:hypothetical protein